MGLHFYDARYREAAIWRFIGTDTIVAGPASGQGSSQYACEGLMDILHHVVTTEPDAERLFRSWGVIFKETPGFRSTMYTADVAESHPHWPDIASQIRSGTMHSIPTAIYTFDEVSAAEICQLEPTSEWGYPEPSTDMRWVQDVYGEVCGLCRVRVGQKSPFRFRKEPPMKRRDFFELIWTSEQFVRHEVASILLDAGIRGFETLAPLVGRRTSTVVTQLRITNEASPGVLGLDVSFKCRKCGRIRHKYPQTRSLEMRRDTVDAGLDMQYSSEWFGDGSGFQVVLVSRRFVQLALSNGWRGIRFRPITVVES